MRRRRIKPTKDAEDHVINATDKTDELLEAKYINDYKGRGVFALPPFNKGDFVVEYRGEMIALIDSERRGEVNNNTVFMFDFIRQNKEWCIDGRHENTTPGRLVNDDNVNEGKSRLCLFASRDIIPGEEITYDYGGSAWPWRKPSCKDDDNMTAIKNCSGGSVTTAGIPRHTVEPSCKDDDSMTAKKNCSGGSVTTAGKATAKVVNSFQQLYQTRWPEYISSTARRTLEEAKWNSPHLLPFTEDVKRLHVYLDEQEKIYRKHLSTQPSSQHWLKLAKVTLTHIHSQMPLTTYTSSNQSGAHPDISMALTELEYKLCQYFKPIEIRGKRGRKVPVLVTPSMQESISLLIKNRSRCGVLNENPFLFARPSAMTFFRGSDCICEFAGACSAKNPQTLTSTKLRKQIGNLNRLVLNLSNTELDQLADFLGHDIRVHSQFYRLPEGTLQLAKMSKILLALEKGRLADFKGRSLDEINIYPEAKVTVDSDLEESTSNLKDCSTESPPQHTVCEDGTLPEDQVSKKKRGHIKRTAWSKHEIHAVKKHMIKFIRNRKVPGKADCLRCMEAEPFALKNREWSALKFYIKNRISALQRKDVAC
ncbi:uncharacterized protein LOC127657553 [Xyrauchen texanus]|uniref:uncharacterized protein LOC127657553 n=1 Tax=Xyrauchen texanus TaxID=154827 RepID=UPI002242799A|nr:uncharacterized protein LOC127657553 [Xyrauchen texanus]